MTSAGGVPSAATEAELEAIIAEQIPFAPMYGDVLAETPAENSEPLAAAPVTTRVTTSAPDLRLTNRAGFC